MGLAARKPDFVVYKQQRCRPAFTSGQSEHHLCYSLSLSILVKDATCQLSEAEQVVESLLVPNLETGFFMTRAMYCG